MTQRARPQRSRRTVRRPDAAEQPAAPATVAAPTSATPARTTTTAGARSQPQPLVKITTTDYGYIVGELCRIGLLTAGMIALLIVLTFIIR